jgi:hypothetical protein
MNNALANLTAQFQANGIELTQIKQEGKTAITMAYLDLAEQNAVAGGLGPGQQDFWLNDNFCKNG